MKRSLATRRRRTGRRHPRRRRMRRHPTRFPTNAVAVVDGTPITRASLDELLDAREAVVHGAEAQLPEGGHLRVPDAADPGRRLPRPAPGVREARPRSSASRSRTRRSRRRSARCASSTSATTRRSSCRAQGSRATPRPRSARRSARSCSPRGSTRRSRRRKVTDADVKKYYDEEQGAVLRRRSRAPSGTSS